MPYNPSFDLSTKSPASTFQQLLQQDGNGLYYDGRGNQQYLGSSSYSLSCSYATSCSFSSVNFVTQSNTTSSLYSISASWASSSLSSSYGLSSSYSPVQLPDITDDTINNRIGINNTNPQYALDVDGNINLTGYIISNDFLINSSGGNSYLNAAGGKVGVGTNAPNNALDVVGNISCSVITASLLTGTSSYANAALSASYAPGNPSISASYALTASYAPGSPSVSASYSLTSSYSVNGGFTLTTGSTYPITSSWSLSSSYSSNIINSVSQSNLLGTASLYSQAFISTGSYISTITASYALSQNENGKLVVVNASSGGLITITVPSTLNQGFGCSLLQYGTQQFSVIGSGTNILNRSQLSSSYGRYSIISLLQINSTNYILQGDIG